MHFSSMSLHLCPILALFFTNSLPISYFFSLTYRYQNNEHENDSADGLGLDFERVIYVGEFSTDEGMEDDDLPLNLLRLVAQDKKQILPHQEVTEAINLRTKEKRREVKIGTTLSPATGKELIDLLRDYSDVFAWSYQDMPGLNTDIVVHRLPLREIGRAHV